MAAGCVVAAAAWATSGPLLTARAQETEKPAAEKPPAEKPPAEKPPAEKLTAKPAKDEPAAKAEKPADADAKPAKPDADSKADPKSEAKPEPKPEAKPDGKTSSEAKGVLKSARDKLVSFRSIKSRIVETVAIGERRFKAEGTYLQGSSLRLRLELTVKSGALTGTLLEVCDGQVLYTQYSVGQSPRITRRDVRQILDAAKTAVKNPETALVAELGLGGLPALLASIEQNMTFHSVREDTIDGQTFTVLEGGWNREYLAAFKAGSPKSGGQLPDHLPDAIRIYFDGKTLLPRRFLYLKKAADKGPPRPMVTLDFLDVVLNAPISDDEFYFVPPDDVPQEDITRAYLERYRGAGSAGDPAVTPPGAPKSPPGSKR